MQAIEVRPARAEDRTAVFAFCERTWGDDGDYIPYVWEQWLADPNGVLLVALQVEQPVGLAHLALLSPSEGWIEGVRVDPALRRQGIGRVLVSRTLAAAHERGVTVVRLMTDADNTASQQLFARFGFERVAMYAHYVADAITADSVSLVPEGFTLRTPGTADLERLWAFLEASNLTPLNGGLLLQGWQARALTSELLEQRLAAGEVWTLEAWGAVQALAIAYANTRGEGNPRLSGQYLDGAAESIGRLALVLRAEAAHLGLVRVRVALPAEVLILHDAMDGAGYTRIDDHTTWCYARTLEPRAQQ